MVKKVFGVAVLSLALLLVSTVRVGAAPGDDILEKLVCQCDCTMLVSDCQCVTQEEMFVVIEQKLALGQSEEEILQSFVDTYGEQVLAEPLKRGLNLVAWILPFVAILSGGGVIYLAMKKWVAHDEGRQAHAVGKVKKGDAEYQRRLEKELENFKEKGFR